MSKICLYEPCNNEATGKSAFCGKSCRAQHSRRNKSSATSEAQQLINQADEVIRDCESLKPPTLADYNDPDGRKYATRANPQLLNWGPTMRLGELKASGLVANRVTIPGDWDYEGQATV